MKQQLKPNAELDLLTRAELHEEIVELASGYLRPTQRVLHPSGFALSAAGAIALSGVYRVEAGMRFILTRMEFKPDGYTASAPWTPSSAGGVDIYVDGTWRDGFAFGGSSGLGLPAVYVEAAGRAIIAQDGALVQVAVAGGPASVGLAINVCGFLEPMPPVL